MKARLWQDYHRPNLVDEVSRAWNDGELLVMVPPGLKNLSAFEPFLNGTDVFPEPAIFGIFTSGTVGHKLIFYSRRNIEASLQGIMSFFDINSIELIYSYPQPFHVFGLVLGYLCAQIYGKRLEVPMGPYSKLAHENWLKTVDATTLTLGTPTHFKDLLAYVTSVNAVPRASYSAILGGAPVTRQVWLDVQSNLKVAAPSIGYGASELSPGATHLGPGITPLEDFEIGAPLPNVKIEVEPGRGMRVRGENVCLGLVENGQLRHPSEIWLQDEVRERSEGRLVFCNRTDLILNRGGEKFSFEQIERLLKSQLAVEAVGVGVPHGRLGEELGLILRKSDLAIVSKEAIYECLRRFYAKDFDPNLCFFIDELPKTASAKIDRRECLQYIKEQHVSPQ